MSGHNVLNELLRAFFGGGPGAVPVVASAAGTRISDDNLYQFVIPTWGNANNIIILPAPLPGRVVVVAGAATGGELRTTDPATIAINGGSAANAESAVAANQMVILICESATSWKAFTIASNGTTAGLEAAAA
jgi:hypothetical protein